MKQKRIVVIGGANLEYLITSENKIIPNNKNAVTMEELYAGSGLNYTLRLLHAGEAVYPILFVGDDYIGHRVQEITLKAIKLEDNDIRSFIENGFLIPGVDTSKSTIIVEGNSRTVLSHDKNRKNLFRPFLEKRVSRLKSPASVIIGHIHNDKPDIAKHEKELSTLYAIDYFSTKASLIYANIGASQIAHGFDFWKKYLPKIDILQLNIHEIKELFQREGEASPPLQNIFDRLVRLNISAIITLDKFGAIGVMKNRSNALFLARPVELGDRFVDSTGAGDAFCAGMVSVLNGKKSFSEEEFQSAMEVARSWAAYACTSYGGANDCPDTKTISAFHKDIVVDNEVLIYKDEGIKDILALIDTTIANGE